MRAVGNGRAVGLLLPVALLLQTEATSGRWVPQTPWIDLLKRDLAAPLSRPRTQRRRTAATAYGPFVSRGGGVGTAATVEGSDERIVAIGGSKESALLSVTLGVVDLRSADQGGTATLLAFDGDGNSSDGLVALFPQSVDLGIACETIGCLCDIVFVKVDRVDDSESEVLLRVVDGLSRLADGVGRLAGGTSPDRQKGGIRKKLLVLISDRSEDESDGGNSIEGAARKLVESVASAKPSVRGFLEGADIITVPFFAPEDEREDHFVMLSARIDAAIQDISQQFQESEEQIESIDVRVSATTFPMLAQQVCRALGCDKKTPLAFNRVPDAKMGLLNYILMGSDSGFSRSVEDIDVGSSTAKATSRESEDEANKQRLGVGSDCDLPGVDDNIDAIVEATPNESEDDLNGKRFGDEMESAVESIVEAAERRIYELEAKQEDVLLDVDGKRMPILEFGQDADSILKEAVDSFESALTSIGGKWAQERFQQVTTQLRTELLKRIAGDKGLLRLFCNQLQSLREHYGRTYESFLDELLNAMQDPSKSEKERSELKEKQEAMLNNAVAGAAEGFRSAAQNAIPKLCREGGGLRDVDGGYDYVKELNGLLTDMMEVAEMRTGMEKDWGTEKSDSLEDDQEEGTSEEGGNKESKRRKGPAKWYEKVAARALVVGVNYAQGWLALQSVRRAAAQRDQDLPKFPLF